MSELTRSYEEAVEFAKQEGLSVHLPRDDELFLDIDSPILPQRLRDCLKEMREVIDEGITAEATRSKSNNWHVRIRFPGSFFTHTERIAWQACLGSDQTREWLALLRVETGVQHPSMFFEKEGWDSNVDKL